VTTYDRPPAHQVEREALAITPELAVREPIAGDNDARRLRDADRDPHDCCTAARTQDVDRYPLRRL
jgi:hypothetical protein